jgi:hypothetical protein
MAPTAALEEKTTTVEDDARHLLCLSSAHDALVPIPQRALWRGRRRLEDFNLRLLCASTHRGNDV